MSHLLSVNKKGLHAELTDPVGAQQGKLSMQATLSASDDAKARLFRRP
jgi:hypothetical protein